MSGNANVAVQYHDVNMHLAYGGSEFNSTKYAKVLSIIQVHIFCGTCKMLIVEIGCSNLPEYNGKRINSDIPFLRYFMRNTASKLALYIVG